MSTIEVDCTPDEARAFLGLPDVTPLNDHLVAEMQKRMDANMSAMQPEELMKTWTSFGMQATGPVPPADDRRGDRRDGQASAGP